MSGLRRSNLTAFLLVMPILLLVAGGTVWGMLYIDDILGLPPDFADVAPPCEPAPLAVDLAPITADRTRDLRVVATLCAPDRALVTALAALPDDRVVVGGRFSQTQVWQLQNAEPAVTLDTGPSAGVVGLPDGSIVVGGHKGSVQRWTLDGSRQLYHADAHPQAVWAVAAHPAGEGAFVTAGGDGTVHRWGNDRIRATQRGLGRLWAVAVDRHKIAVGGAEMNGGEGGGYAVLDASDLRVLGVHEYEDPIWSIAAAGGGGWFAGTEQHVLQGRWSLDLHSGTVSSVAMLPDRTMWVAGTWGGIVAFGHAKERKRLGWARADMGRVQVLAVDPGQRWFAGGGDGGIVRIFGIPTGARP